jgi:pimeloyl-ACP methyl ester carboxylesterase
VVGHCDQRHARVAPTDAGGYAAAAVREAVRVHEDGAPGDVLVFLTGTDECRWAADAWMVLDHLTTGPQILVGSSMGGWIAALLARAAPERVHAMLGIAPAPDFTETLMWPQFTPEIRATILRDGVWHRPSDYGEPYAITRALIEDGRQQQVMTEPLPFRFPVRILQGMRDTDVPWRHALRFAEAIAGDDVRVNLVKDGDHRLSRPQDIALLIAEITRLIEE